MIRAPSVQLIKGDSRLEYDSTTMDLEHCRQSHSGHGANNIAILIDPHERLDQPSRIPYQQRAQEKREGTVCSPDQGSGSAKVVMAKVPPKQPRESQRAGRFWMSLYLPERRAVFI